MLIAGIIAEYNPFHNGHALHISQTKREGADAVIAVMSSNYVQRGEPAVMSKFARARAAVECGADLVIELPVIWSTANAQSFSMGGVSLLQALGCVDMLSFGSECGDTQALCDVAAALESDEVNAEIKQQLQSGISFAAARELAVRKICGESAGDILTNANDILAVEYISALKKYGSSISPLAVKRTGAQHDDDSTNGKIASSSLIRTLLPQGGWERYVPPQCAEVIHSEIEKGATPINYKRLETAILLKLRGMSAERFSRLPDISEGLENRLYYAARQATSLDELFSMAKTKRYSHARIRRATLHALLGITAEAQRLQPPYVRVLACANRGGEVLKTLKDCCSLPIISKWSEIKNCSNEVKEVVMLECKATDIFALSMPVPAQCGTEFTTKVYFGRET